VARVQLLLTCLVQGFFPEVAEATRLVLERAGCEVTVPPTQTCCGQPAFNTGLTDEARTLAGKLITELAGGHDPVVIPSGSCADMIIHRIPELLEESPGLAESALEVAGRVRELTAYLVDDLGTVELGASFPCRAAYHPSCHGLRNLGLGSQALALLDRVEGLERVEVDRAEECCGFGGLFSLELPELSAAIMATKLAHIEQAAPEVLVGGDVSCLLHLAGGLHRRGSDIRVLHISQILAGEQ
jgi:L-lactate dehydrogenase complex protein LldE